MNNAKKLVYTILFLFATMIFQIFIIIKLNTIDRKLVLANTTNHDITADAPIAEDSSDNIITESQDINETTIIIQNDYSDIDNVLSDENLSKYFTNSLFIGDSRTDGLRKFTKVSKYASFCCDVGININKLTSDTFFINGENITLYDAVNKNKFNRIFICIGYNELGWEYEDAFISKYSQLLTELKTIIPETSVTVLSILHVANDASIYDDSENNERIDLYNSKIKSLCETLSINYIDLNAEFTDSSGYLLEESSSDGIHFTNEYYRKYLYKLFYNIIRS